MPCEPWPQVAANGRADCEHRGIDGIEIVDLAPADVDDAAAAIKAIERKRAGAKLTEANGATTPMSQSGARA